ncbi:Hsp20/alpha crystallin family protein [Halolamina litorea]|uniref:Hsp20/alpha crystallin family protein n=1 Tax=Halolamina litorea TaxID=1515593 RepID=A0ABD6BP55_9EURY|nr:Hsp20/alpha crystallin family protein [Halolamina litorea]
MTTHQRRMGDEQFGRVYEYDDSLVVALDLADAEGEVAVDTVGETAIVVVENADGTSTETEFELPGEARECSLTNGVLTIEVEA